MAHVALSSNTRHDPEPVCISNSPPTDRETSLTCRIITQRHPPFFKRSEGNKTCPRKKKNVRQHETLTANGNPSCYAVHFVLADTIAYAGSKETTRGFSGTPGLLSAVGHWTGSARCDSLKDEVPNSHVLFHPTSIPKGTSMSLLAGMGCCPVTNEIQNLIGFELVGNGNCTVRLYA